MPITVEIANSSATDEIFKTVFGYFSYIDETFSTYKSHSEIMHINRGELIEADWSEDMKAIFELAEAAREKTGGYFDIQKPDGSYDPSGLVKGWAIQNVATIIRNAGFENFYIDAGGDIQTSGMNPEGEPWRIGIKNPFNEQEVVKVLQAKTDPIRRPDPTVQHQDFPQEENRSTPGIPNGTSKKNGQSAAQNISVLTENGTTGQNLAVATSGTYIRGLHIYNPKTGMPADDMISLTVVGDHICDVDLVATAAFAMGDLGIRFVEEMPGFEAYAIDKDGMATMTSGFHRYVS